MWPVYTFRLKLASPLRNSWLLPNNTQPLGNETEAESVNIPKTFTSWIPSNLPGPNICQQMPDVFSGHNGSTFVAMGEQALYLKRTYANGSPDDLLELVS